MKRISLFAATLAALSLASCNKADQNPPDPVIPSQSVQAGEKCPLTINFPNVEPLTKVALSSSDNSISNVQVMVFNNTTNLLEAAVDITSTSTTIYVSSGPKTVWAVANVPVSSHSFLTAANAAAITSVVTDLADNTIGGTFVMIGHADKEVTALDKAVSIDLYRVAAKIEIGDIKVNYASAALAGHPVTIDRVYVQDAVVKSTFAQSKSLAVSDFVNQNAFSTSAYDAFLKTDYSSSNTIAAGATSSAFAAKYYVYPNQSDEATFGTPYTVRKTRLVIEATIAGNKTYYPVLIGPIESNKYYKLSTLTITGYGIDDPAKDATKIGLEISLSVKDWQEGEVFDHEI